MKRKIIIILLLAFSILFSFTKSSAGEIVHSKFKIVFVADPRVANNKDWLNRIATDWGATGICLRIFWGHVDTNSTPGADTWTNLDNAIKTIANNQYDGKELDIYLRVCMGLQKPVWVSPANSNFTRDDFQIQYNDLLYDHQTYENGIPDSELYPLNFSSSNSIKRMKDFFKEVLEHINSTFSESIKFRIKEVVPTFSASDEEEYPYAAMCGYSSHENSAFRNYLENKYSNSLFKLNKKWNPDNTWKNINSWSDITPGNYNWHSYENSFYIYPNGRVDWINFRMEQLSSFINSLVEISSLFGFQTGLQLGSIYDGIIEKRGWIDPTKLFEKVNSVHVADIYQYSANFNFAADYLRSLCRFWTVTNNKSSEPIRFSSETNWPNFDNRKPSFLSRKWKQQLISYYDKGAFEHYIVGWDISVNKLDSCKSKYDLWRNTLLSYSNKDIVSVSNQNAVHLGTEQVLFHHNPQSVEGRFELYNSIIAQWPYASTDGNYMDGKDIITNYMIEKNSTYLNNYSTIYFTKASEYITEKAYSELIKDEVITPYINSTWFSNNGNDEYAYIQGLKNEYNEIRSPTYLILRSLKYSE